MSKRPTPGSCQQTHMHIKLRTIRRFLHQCEDRLTSTPVNNNFKLPGTRTYNPIMLMITTKLSISRNREFARRAFVIVGAWTYLEATHAKSVIAIWTAVCFSTYFQAYWACKFCMKEILHLLMDLPDCESCRRHITSHVWYYTSMVYVHKWSERRRQHRLSLVSDRYR